MVQRGEEVHENTEYLDTADKSRHGSMNFFKILNYKFFTYISLLCNDTIYVFNVHK